MTLTETLIAISISTVIAAGTSLTFVSYAKNSSKLAENGRTANEILKTDERLREHISSVRLPYHLSAAKEAERQAAILKDKYAQSDDIKINSVTFLKNSSGITQGLEVLWERKGKEYKTKELFASVSVLK